MPEKIACQELNERAKDVLRTLIREYVRTGKPVGSRRMSKIYREGLSPATLRNVMSDLEEMGFVKQPHTSAGRVPTEGGYRLYVDSLVNNRGLSGREIDQIKESLEGESDPVFLMNRVSQLLSAYSKNVGFVVAPPVSRAVMKHVEFVRLSKDRILVILVTGAGFVQHRTIRNSESLSQAKLTEAGNYLVRHFCGLKLAEIRDELIRSMSREKNLYDQMLQNVLLLGTPSLIESSQDSAQESEVYVSGTTQIIRRPELSDVTQLLALFQTFEEKSRLVTLISACLKEDTPAPMVLIGLSEFIPGMNQWALITSPFVCDLQTFGGLGILGPSRMEYEKAISLVDYVARLFGRILSRN